MVLRARIIDYTQVATSYDNSAEAEQQAVSLSQRNCELMERFRHYLWLERGLSENTVDSYSSESTKILPLWSRHPRLAGLYLFR